MGVSAQRCEPARRNTDASGGMRNEIRASRRKNERDVTLTCRGDEREKEGKRLIDRRSYGAKIVIHWTAGCEMEQSNPLDEELRSRISFDKSAYSAQAIPQNECLGKYG